MPTLNGDWDGSSPRGRIVCVYTRSYNTPHTDALFSGTLYVEFDGAVNDSVNTWTVEGDDGTHNGSNLNISLGSGGGRKKLWDFAFWKKGTGSIRGIVRNVEANGGVTINSTFALDAGELAPYFNNTNYYAGSITDHSFGIGGLSVNGNGTALVSQQLQWNTSASEVGVQQVTTAVGSGLTATGLQGNRLYYFRVRVSNAAGYWTEWGPWKTVATDVGAPRAPAETFYFYDITQTTAKIGGLAANNNGTTILGWWIEFNTAPTPVGALTTSAFPETPPWGMMAELEAGTKYYARIMAFNAVGDGPWSSWKEFTTSPGTFVKVDGVWKNAEIFVKVNGSWKPAQRFVRVAGAWKQ